MNAIIYRTHINFHSACYHCRPVCGRLSSVLLDSGELEFQHLVTTNTSEKQISVLTLLNPCNRCSPTAKPGWGSAVNLCERLSTNPHCSEPGVSQPAPFLCSLKGLLSRQGKNWLPRGCPSVIELPWERRSMRWLHMSLLQLCDKLSTLGTIYIQSHNLICITEVRQNQLHWRTHTPHSLIINGIMIQREQELRPAHTTHCDVVERCGACEWSRYICHLELMPLHLSYEICQMLIEFEETRQ